MFTGINVFFITHGYNTSLLNYDITAAAGTGDRGARTPRGYKERNNQETLKNLRFCLGNNRVRTGRLTIVRESISPTGGAFKGKRPRVVKFKEYNYG